MEYNTQREHMILPEYGRNVQNMIAHAMELADREQRNKAAFLNLSCGLTKLPTTLGLAIVWLDVANSASYRCCAAAPSGGILFRFCSIFQLLVIN